MTIVLVALGSSLFGVAMFLLSKIPPTGTFNHWWLYGALIAIACALGAYGIALWREWKRERKRDQIEKEREQRETAREQREIKRHNQYMSQFGEGGYHAEDEGGKST